MGKTNTIKMAYELKEKYTRLCHSLKKEETSTQFKRTTGLIGLKELVRKQEVTTKELKELWKNSKNTIK